MNNENINSDYAEGVIGSYDEIPTVDGDHFICLTCRDYLKKEKLPPMSHSNRLEMFSITKEYECLKLTELEQCVIARSLLFMKIHKLPKSRMGAVKDKIVNVPVSEEDVRNTLDVLMRTSNEAGIIAVKIKRKQQYKSAHKEEYVSVEKVKKALILLKELESTYIIPNQVKIHTAL